MGEGGEGEGKGAEFGSKLDVQGQDGGRTSDIDGQGVGGLENWTIFMDVICVSSLTVFVSFLKVLSLAGKISEKMREKKLLVKIKALLLIKSLKGCKWLILLKTAAKIRETFASSSCNQILHWLTH